MVPGAYQSKGGHWRARWSRFLAEWLEINSRMPGEGRVVAWSEDLAEQRQQLIGSTGRYREVDSLIKLRSQLTRRIQKLKAIRDAPIPDHWTYRER